MVRRGVLFGIVFVLCILIVPGQVSLYVQSGNLWTAYLGGCWERNVLLFKDGALVGATCYMENFVAIPWDTAFSEGRRPCDLLVVIHNHLTLDRWSTMDDKMNHLFRARGYDGPILLRLGSGEVIEWDK